MNNPSRCLIYNASQIVQVVSNKEKYVRGNFTQKIKDLSVLEKKESDKLSIVSIKLIIFYLEHIFLHYF
jgi:hypothetical protein